MIIDISKYQSQIDWHKLKTNSQGVTGVYIKATEGHNYTDEQFRQHVAGAESIQFDKGFYHFATLNSTNVVADATQEATDFAARVKGIIVRLPYVLDIEANPIKLSPDDTLLYIKTFFVTLEKNGITDIAIYSYTPFLNSNLPDGHGLGDIKLWLAAYAPFYLLPRGWYECWLWQFSQNGIVDGITGNVDLSK